MLKEFLPAVEWLEQEYAMRDQYTGWASRSDRNPDGTPVSYDVDFNQYRRGLYQTISISECGTPLWLLCQEANSGIRCRHEEHQKEADCWCFGGVPGAVQGLPWTAEDEAAWLLKKDYRGDHERFDKYLRGTHPYIWDRDMEMTPNNTEWWKDENAAA